MASLKKTYLLVQDERYPPGTDIIIGSIITDPFAPQLSLSAKATLPVPSSALRTSTQTDWKGVKGKQRGGSIGIYAQFLSALGAGGDLEVGVDKSLTHNYQFDRLETEFFEPAQEYLLKSLHLPAVAKFVEDTDFERDLYMIIGIKVAYGARIGSTAAVEHNFKAQVGVSAAAVGVPVEGGPKFSTTSKDTDEVSFGSCSPFVFAYRVRKIHYSKRKNVLTTKDFTKGAAYSLDEGEAEAEVVVGDNFGMQLQVGGLDANDLGAEDLDVKGVEVVDEADEEACECVLPQMFE